MSLLLQRVPYRDSTLTRLLRDPLSGMGRTVMIATANSSPNDYDENAQALKYAALARQIRCAHKVDTRNLTYTASKLLR